MKISFNIDILTVVVNNFMIKEFIKHPVMKKIKNLLKMIIINFFVHLNLSDKNNIYLFL